MSELRQFAVQVLINRIEPFLQLLLIQFADRVMRRVMVDIG